MPSCITQTTVSPVFNAKYSVISFQAMMLVLTQYNTFFSSELCIFKVVPPPTWCSLQSIRGMGNGTSSVRETEAPVQRNRVALRIAQAERRQHVECTCTFPVRHKILCHHALAVMRGTLFIAV